MQIIIENNRIIKLAQLFEEQERVIYNRFRVKDPKAFRKRAMKTGKWDGYYKFYDIRNQTLRKGYLKYLIELCIKYNFPFDIVDLRDKSKYPAPPPKSFDNQLIDGITAHKHQMRCWNSVCSAHRHQMFEIGTHFHPTGSGKSAMMAGIVKLMRCPTVIITDQTIVLNQLTKALKLFNVVHHDDIGEFYSGKMPEGNIVCIGSIAALRTPKKPMYSKFNVKLSTLNKDFNKMLNNKKEDLKKIVTYNGMLAWMRSNIIDSVRSKAESKKKEHRDSVKVLLPHDFKCWFEQVSNYVYEQINDLVLNDEESAINVLGTNNVDIWKETQPINNCYEDELEKALSRFYSFEKEYYFKIALKSYHTLIAKTRELQEMVGECELLLVDEMDNAASGNYDELFDKWFNGRYIHGFSGTPYDNDKPVEKMVLEGRFGPIISSSKRKELEDIGQIQPIRYYMIQFGDISPKDKTAFDIAEREIIIDNNEFHKVIVKLTNLYSDGKTLIVVDTSNIEDIGCRLEELIPKSTFLYNKVSQTKRKKAIEDFENGNIKILIVSKIGKRGMDLGGGAHTQIIIGGGKLRSNFDQIIGRGVRKNDKGFTRVFDFYFTGNKYLLDHSRKKLRFVVDMGYTSNFIFNGKTIEAGKFIKSRFRLPN